MSIWVVLMVEYHSRAWVSTRSALALSRLVALTMAQFVRADLLVDARLLQHPPQVSPRRLRRHRLLARRAGEHELPARLVFQPEPEHRAECFRQRRQPLLQAFSLAQSR